jgi:hypothetical protein
LNNPFKNPDKYKYPYNHITLDHLVLVYQMENRLELLEEAEKRNMSHAEFANFVINWSVGYNLENKNEKYSVYKNRFDFTYIKNNDLKRFWENDKLMFNLR